MNRRLYAAAIALCGAAILASDCSPSAPVWHVCAEREID